MVAKWKRQDHKITLTLQTSLIYGWPLEGCFLFTKRFQKIRMQSKRNKTFWVVPGKISVSTGTSKKGVLLKTEIRVKFLESNL